MKKSLAALGMAAIAACATAGGGKMNGVQQQMQVEANNGKVMVKMTVTNGTAAPVYVAKAVFQADQLFGRAFDITHLDSAAPVDYIGPMVKRGPPTAADFMAIKPGATHSHAIDITRSYDFKSGTHRYQLRFAGNYLGNLARLDTASRAVVAPVTFSFTK